MAYKNGNAAVTVLVIIVVALGAAAVLLHLHRTTEWSHGASSTAGIARYVEQGVKP
jgi:hypothetical protein